MKIQDLIEAAKYAFIHEAQSDFERSGVEWNVSKLAMASGLQRKDVSRLLENPLGQSSSGTSLLTAVIGRWQSDKKYLDGKKKPRKLQFEGANSEFAALVQSVSTDLNPYTVLFELERIGAVHKTGGAIALTAEIFHPKQDIERGLELLASDMNDMVSGIEENIFGAEALPNLHISTFYDNVCPKFLPQIRGWLLDRGAKFHEEARSYLARFDKDLNPKLFREDGGARIIVGTFSNTPGLKESSDSSSDESEE